MNRTAYADTPEPSDEPTPSRPWLAGALAIASTGAALALALGLRPILSPVVTPLFLLAVAVTALQGGIWPGLLAVALSALALNFWFFPPTDAFGFATSEDLIQQLVFAISAVLIAAIVAQARIRRLAAEARTREAVRLALGAEELRREAEATFLTHARRQAALADLGRRVMHGAELQSVLEDAARTVAQTLDVPLTGILELLPSRDALLLRAGVGWQDELLGHATVDATPDSLVGRALTAGDPTVSGDFSVEARADDGMLSRHGVISVAIVPVTSPEGRFGLLGAFTTDRRDFSTHDTAFLEAVADLLAAKLRREHLEQVFRESATDGVVTIDRQWRFTFANRRAGEIAGRPAQDLFEQTIWDAMPALVATPYEEELRHAMEQQVPGQAGFFLPGIGQLDGRMFPNQDGLVLLWSSAGRQLRALEASGAGSWEWEVETGRVILSRAAGELHGVPSDRAIDLAELLERIHPVDRERVRSILTRSASERSECALEYRVLRSSEISRLVVARGRVLDRGGDSAPRMIGIVMALPELDQLVQPRLADPEPSTDGPMVLVVQTEATSRQLASQALEREGYRWLTAADAAEALALLERYDIPIDLLVTELHLPDLSGEELVDRVRERYPGLPVVYVPEASPSDPRAEGQEGLMRQVRSQLRPRADHPNAPSPDSLAVSPPGL
jgi:PAS domain-containing protein